MPCIRLQVTLAKIQQSLPELKRDGNNVLASVWANMLYADNSTSRAGGILPQTDFIPQLIQDLQTSTDKVIADFNELKKYCEFPISTFDSIT
jgi:Zn-dependent M16 (insulinase) family peptidase